MTSSRGRLSSSRATYLWKPARNERSLFEVIYFQMSLRWSFGLGGLIRTTMSARRAWGAECLVGHKFDRPVEGRRSKDEEE